MSHIFKELLYHTILYEYEGDQEEQQDGFIDLDSASIEEIQRQLGEFK